MLNYFLNLLLAFVCIPYLYFAIRRLRKEIPVLPNAVDLNGSEGAEHERALSLLFLGESAIAGVGVRSNNDGLGGQVSKNLAAKLQTKINWDVIAHTGYDSQLVIDKLLPQLHMEHYDLILIQLCVNDTLKLIPPVIYSLRLESIINFLINKYPKSKILFVNNAPVRDMSFPPLVKYILGNIIDEYGKVIEHLVIQDEHLYFINQKLKYSDWQRRYPDKPREEFFSDGVHPSAFTYARWSEDISEYIIDRKIIS